MMRKISMWSGPRNVSTAIMYSFAQRPDTKVVDEPFYGYYLKRTGFEHPGYNDLLDELATDPGEIINQMNSSGFDKEIVFYKNMAHHLYGLELDFVYDFTNLILIRDPGQVLTSLVKTLDNIKLIDTGFEFQWKLFDELNQRNLPTIIIDSKDLLENPEEFLKKLCDTINIPFYDSMLRWKVGGIPEDGPWAKYWYHNVHKSEGFMPFTEVERTVPESLRDLYEICKDYYKKLSENKLTI